MINFDNLSQQPPFLLFKEKYDEAIVRGQKNIEAISISSYNTKIKEVDSRFVNLKFIANDEFIFFTNYKSPKASAFYSHKQIAALVYWPSINVQIRMKAKIKQTTQQYNQKYFIDRSLKKNALAISSNQSEPISSYEKLKTILINLYKMMILEYVQTIGVVMLLFLSILNSGKEMSQGLTKERFLKKNVKNGTIFFSSLREILLLN